jgi:hypothetical protein
VRQEREDRERAAIDPSFAARKDAEWQAKLAKMREDEAIAERRLAERFQAAREAAQQRERERNARVIEDEQWQRQHEAEEARKIAERMKAAKAETRTGE